MILGFNVEVPQGRLTGGTFRTLPLCTRVGQTGCVVTYVSFRAEAPPPEGALFGRAAAPGNTVACTNPAALGSDARAPLDSYWFSDRRRRPSRSPGPRPGPRRRPSCAHRAWSRPPASMTARSAISRSPSTPTRPTPAPTGFRATSPLLGIPAPGWGIHLVDVNVAQGDLIRLVAAQSAAWSRRRR